MLQIWGDQPATVSVINGTTNSVIATVPVGMSPCDIAVNPQTNKIYVTNRNGQSLTVIDGATNNTTTVNVGDQPCGLAVNTATNKVYVANQASGNITVMDGSTNNTVTLTVTGGPLFIAVNSVTNKIYVACSSGIEGNVTQINGVTNETTNILFAEENAGSTAINSVTNKVYVSLFAYHGSGISIIDGATFTLASGGYGADTSDPVTGEIAIDATSNKIYVPQMSGSVAVIDGATGSVAKVKAGQGPSTIVVDSGINRIYVPSGTAPSPGMVTVINGVSNSTTTLAVGVSPTRAAVNPVTHRVYVTNYCGNDLSCNTDGPVEGTVTVIEAAH